MTAGPTFDLRIGHVLDRLREIPNDSVHAVVTSPPYWNLREYGTPPQVWGGDPQHEHEWTQEIPGRKLTGGTGKSTLGEASGGNAISEEARIASQQAQGFEGRPTQFCACGAWHGELGQEPDPKLFVEHLVDVFEQVRRVLRPDGVCFVNMGDSYAANRSYQVPSTKAGNVGNNSGSRVPAGLKPKDLCLVPQRLAIALQDAGWWVRADIVWSKPNAMPESVEDRPARSHENILMLTKSSRYFWDRVAVLEDAALSTLRDHRFGQPVERDVDEAAQRFGEGTSASRRTGGSFLGTSGGSRNLRSVWEINTESFPGAHFAVMAKRVAEKCILAATSERGCCAECGAQVVRLVESESLERSELPPDHPEWRPRRYEGKADQIGLDNGQRYAAVKTLGWEPGCTCGAPTVPSTVLDPFFGAGTTTLVARRLHRSSIGIELSDDFAALGRERMATWWKDVNPSRQRPGEDALTLFDVCGTA